MKQVISFSLWGANPKYTFGMIENAKLAKIFYPAWECWCFCGQSVPSEILQNLLELDVKIIQMGETGDNRGMFWRFYPVADTSIDCVIVRDADSRLSEREAKAVEEWLKTSNKGHIMRDHPLHTQLMMGGMWGVHGHIIPNMRELIDQFTPKDEYNNDQEFLAELIYPILVEHGVCVHASYSQYEKDCRLFPTHRNEYSFIGEIFDENNCRRRDWRTIRILEASNVLRFYYKLCDETLIIRHKLALRCKRSPFGATVWSVLRHFFKITRKRG